MTGERGAPETRVAVKICGLRDAAHMAVAAGAGAAMLGFVFAPSTRRIAPEAAAALIAALRRTPGSAAPLSVGVFVNEAPARMAGIAAGCGLDVLQLSGDERPDPATLRVLGRPVICMLRPGAAPDATAATAAAWQAAAARADAADGPVRGPWGSRLLIGLDARHGDSYGGTGVLADWTLARRLAARGPLLLAGGLTPANVPTALAAVRPWAVDVSSGVETAGSKDPALIGAFLAAALQYEF